MIARSYWSFVRSLGGDGATRFAVPAPEIRTAAIVVLAVTFNFGLAILNANYINVSRAYVIGAEVLLVGAAVAICAKSFSRLMIPWIVVTWALLALFILLTLLRQSLEPKYFRDVLLIPIFITLGMTYAKGNIVRLFVVLQGIVLAVMIFEGAFSGLFGQIVNPLKYYVNSRETAATAFWNPDSQLYLSAFRPKGRLFDWLDIHRLSSIFLEPVSLGNWCIVLTVFLTSFWRDLSRSAAIFFLVSTILILIGSDGRLATVTIIVILVVSNFALRMPRYSYFFYLPASIAIAFILVAIFEPGRADDFLGRLNRSVTLLSSMDVWGILGLETSIPSRSADSGISYIIWTQSILGTAVLWASICFLLPPASRTAVLFMHGLCVYIALILMISFALFSIKTAAPLWFLYGYIRARDASKS